MCSDLFTPPGSSKGRANNFLQSIFQLNPLFKMDILSVPTFAGAHCQPLAFSDYTLTINSTLTVSTFK